MDRFLSPYPFPGLGWVRAYPTPLEVSMAFEKRDCGLPGLPETPPRDSSKWLHATTREHDSKCLCTSCRLLESICHAATQVLRLAHHGPYTQSMWRSLGTILRSFEAIGPFWMLLGQPWCLLSSLWCSFEIVCLP